MPNFFHKKQKQLTLTSHSQTIGVSFQLFITSITYKFAIVANLYFFKYNSNFTQITVHFGLIIFYVHFLPRTSPQSF